MDVLVVVDMQNDFISGALGTAEAEAIVGKVAEKIRSFDGRVFFTRDTHGPDYLSTQEGAALPVPHCIAGTPGWELHPAVAPLADAPIDKPTYGSVRLAETIAALAAETPVGRVTLVGLCTDVCVISNALLLKAFLPETPIAVDASCCAGVTPESHRTALDAMRACHIEIL